MFEYKGMEITNVEILPSKYGDCSIYHLVAKKDIEIGGMHRKRGQKFCGRVMRRGVRGEDYTFKHFQEYGCADCKKWLDRMVESEKQIENSQQALGTINIIGGNKQSNKDLINAWKNNLRILNYSVQSIQKYGEYAELFVRFIHKPLIETKNADLYGFFGAKTKEGKDKSTNTKNAQKFALIDMFRYLMDNGAIIESPFETKSGRRNAFNFKGEQKIKMPLSDDELDTIADYLSGKKDPRDYVLFNMLLGTGGRKSEILNMQLKDLIVDNSSGVKFYWAIVFGKGAKERPIPLQPELTEVIDRYISMKQITDPEALLFTNKKGEKLDDRYLNQVFTKIAKETGISHFSPHSLRHTFATNMIEQDGNLGTLQELMGHVDPKVTARYKHIHDQIKLDAILRGAPRVH
ncbi:MAG: tyrosine-type recombinase/integrase [Bacteroidota bacterium]|nr:tyrosine-type recombinase/integrase [Bacteroidota bacterium]